MDFTVDLSSCAGWDEGYNRIPMKPSLAIRYFSRAALFFLAAFALSLLDQPQALAGGDLQKIRAINKELDQITEKAREMAKEEMGSEWRGMSQNPEYRKKLERALLDLKDKDPEFAKMFERKKELLRKAYEEQDKFKEQQQELIYDVTAGLKSKDELSPDELEIVTMGWYSLSKEQQKALEEEGVHPSLSAESFAKDLGEDLNEQFTPKVPETKEPESDFGAADAVGGLGAFGGGRFGGRSGPGAGDMNPMSGNNPTGGTEAHHHHVMMGGIMRDG